MTLLVPCQIVRGTVRRDWFAIAEYLVEGCNLS